MTKRHFPCNDEKLRMIVASYAVSDFDKWFASFQENDANTSLHTGESKTFLTVACCETARKDGVPKTGIVIQTYHSSDEDKKIKTFLEKNAASPNADGGLNTPSIMTYELMLDQWEIDPETLSGDEKLAVYIGGHGVLNFDSWLAIFEEYPHDKDFPGAVRTLVGKGPNHADGTESCVYVHFFMKSCEKMVHDLMFGEEKKLSVMKHSVVLPYHPDIYADVGYMT